MSDIGIFTPLFWVTAAGSLVSSWQTVSFGSAFTVFLLNGAGINAGKIVIHRGGGVSLNPNKICEAVPGFFSFFPAIAPNSEMLVVTGVVVCF